MFLNAKNKRIKILITAVILTCMLTACGLGGGKNSGNSSPSQSAQQTQQNSQGQNTGSKASGSVLPEDSILNFQNDKSFARLQADMEKGDIPLECNVLYDEGGSRPDVTVTDKDSIKEIYNQLADITVGGKSSQSVTDSYHHITFRLRNDTYVSFYFEGEDLFCWGKDNYEVSGGKNLWNTVRKLQIAAMNSPEKQGQAAGQTGQAAGQTGQAAGQTEQAASSKTNSSPVNNSDTGNTKKNEVMGKVPEDNQSDVTIASGQGGSPLGGTKGNEPGTAIEGEEPVEEYPQEPAVENDTDETNRTVTDKEKKPASDISGDVPKQNAADSSGTKPEGTADSEKKAQEEKDKYAANPGKIDLGQFVGDAQEDSEAGTSDTEAPENAAATDTAENAKKDFVENISNSTTAATAEAATEIADPALNPVIEAAYTDIVRAYAKVLAIDKDTFMDAYSRGLYSKEAPNSELAPDFDERINYDLFLDLYTGALEGSAVYGLHDYNNDGIQELVIALADGEYKTLRAMYTFDGKKAVSLFTGSITPAYRVDVFSLPNAEFLVHSSGGAASGGDTICRIADDASGMQIIADYEYDATKNGNLDHISKTGEVLTEDEFYAKYSDTKNPVEGLVLNKVSEDAAVSLKPAE